MGALAQAKMREAVLELMAAVLSDRRLDGGTDGVVRDRIVKQHTASVAERHGLRPIALALEMIRGTEAPAASPVDITDLVELGIIADGNPQTAETVSRMGYKGMVAAVTVCFQPLVDIGIVKTGSSGRPWAVVEHVTSDDGSCEREWTDVATLNEALATYLSAIKRYGMASSPRM